MLCSKEKAIERGAEPCPNRSVYEQRKMRELARSRRAPADWQIHAQMGVENWAGKTPQEIALAFTIFSSLFMG